MYGLRLRHETMEPICLREAGKLGVSSWRLPEEGHYGGGYNSEQREASAALLRAPRFDEARPNSRKFRSVKTPSWGRSGKEARLMAKFHRLLSRTDESDRRLLLHMARKMADHKTA